MSKIETGNRPTVKKCFSFLNYSTKADFPYIEGGISSDTRFAWQFGGSCLMVVDLIRESLLTRLDLKTVTNSKDTKITAVIECPVFDTSNESKNWNKPRACLIVSYYNIGERGSGHLLILHPPTNRILETIHVSHHVTAMEIITTKWISGCPLRGILRRMSGSLAYGTIEGRVFVMDLKHSGLAYRLFGKMRNQIEVKTANQLLMVDIHSDDNDQIYEMIRECYSSEKRIAFQLISEGSSNDGNVILDVRRDKYGEYSTVTAMKYIPQILFLAVGTEIGVFKLWNMSDYTCLYTSVAKEASISHFQFQEPCNDPHNMCYLWVMFESSKQLRKGLPHANMFRMTFKDMTVLEPYGTYYSNIQQRRTEKKFLMAFDKQNGINGRWVTSQTIVSKRSSYANLDHTITDEEASKLNLLVATFEAWNGVHRELKMIVFDMNQWYRHLMPSNYSEDLSSPFANTIALSMLNIPKRSLFYVRVKEETIFHFPTYNAGQKEHHPSSLSFEALLMYESKVMSTHFVGAQKYILNAITKEGPMAIVNPKHHYELARSAGLISHFCKIDNLNKPTLADQRVFLMSVLLEYRLPNLLKSCISEWSDGSKTISGCTLPFILEWVWSTALKIKKSADRLCVTLFDYSGIELDKENYQKLRNWKHSLLSILNLLEYALKNYKEYLLEDTLEGQVESLKAVTKYFDVLIWCLDCNLLPEKADEESDLIPAYIKKITETTRTRRSELKKLSSDESDSEKNPVSLIIDEIISMEPKGKQLLEQWKNESYGLCDGMYPPSNLQSIIRMFLLPHFPVQTKYAIFTYFLIDTGLNIEERQTNPMPASKHFSVIFGLPEKLRMMAKAYWHIDHGSFKEGSDLLLNGHLSAADIPHCLHMKILKMLVYCEDKSILLKYIQIMRPNFCGAEEHRFHITLLLLNGLLMDAFKITKNVTPMRDELLHHFFQACDTLGHLKKVFHIPMSFEEEQAFASYLDSCKTEEADTLRVMYLFSTGRYPEAIDTNKKLNMIRPTSGLGRHSGPGKNNLSTRDMIANAFEKTLPPITRDLLTFQAKDKSILFQNPKPSANPTPLSSILHTDMNGRRPDFKGSNDVIMQLAMMKTRELWNNNYVPPINKNLKVRSDVELIPFLRSGRYETLQRFPKPAKVEENVGSFESFISIKRKMTEDTEIPVKRSRLNENLVSDEEKMTIESNELINTSFVSKKFSVLGRAIEAPTSILKNTGGTRIKHTRKVDFSEPLEEPKTPPINVAPISRLPTPHISRILKNETNDSPSDSLKEICSKKKMYSMESAGDEELFVNFDMDEIEEKNDSSEKGLSWLKASRRELSFSEDNSVENVTPSAKSGNIDSVANISPAGSKGVSSNADVSTSVMQVEDLYSESSDSTPDMDYDMEERNEEVEMVDVNDLIASERNTDNVANYKEREMQFETTETHREIPKSINISECVSQSTPSVARSANVSQDEDITIIDLDSDESDAANNAEESVNLLDESEGEGEWEEEEDVGESDEVSYESEGGSYESEGELTESEKKSPESPEPEKTYQEAWKSEATLKEFDERSRDSEEFDEQSRESWEPEEGMPAEEESYVVEESPTRLTEEGLYELEEEDYSLTFGNANYRATYGESWRGDRGFDRMENISHAGVEEENLAAYSNLVVEEYVTSVTDDNETVDVEMPDSNVTGDAMATQPANTFPMLINADLLSSMEVSSDMMRNIQDILRNRCPATEERQTERERSQEGREENQKEESAAETPTKAENEKNVAGYEPDPNIVYLVGSTDSESPSDSSEADEGKEMAENKSVGHNSNVELVVDSSDSDASNESSSSKASSVENSSFNILLHASSQQQDFYSTYQEEDEVEYYEEGHNDEADDEEDDDEDSMGSLKNTSAEDEYEDDDGEEDTAQDLSKYDVDSPSLPNNPATSPPVIIVTKDNKRGSKLPGQNDERLSEKLLKTPPKKDVETTDVTPKKKDNVGASTGNAEITPSGLKFLSEIISPKEETKSSPSFSKSIFDDTSCSEKPNIIPVFFGKTAMSPVSEILQEISASEVNSSGLFGMPGSREVNVAEEENMEMDVSQGEIRDEITKEAEQPLTKTMELEVENVNADASELRVPGIDVAGAISQRIDTSESSEERCDENFRRFVNETRMCDNVASYSKTAGVANETVTTSEPLREQIISETANVANAVGEATTIECSQRKERLITETIDIARETIGSNQHSQERLITETIDIAHETIGSNQHSQERLITETIDIAHETIGSNQHSQERLITETIDIAHETIGSNQHSQEQLITEIVDVANQTAATSEPSLGHLIVETVDITNQTTVTYEPSKDELISETIDITNQTTATYEPSPDQLISETINIADTVCETTSEESQAHLISETINLSGSDEDESEMEFKNPVIQETILLSDSDEGMECDVEENQDEIREREETAEVEDNNTHPEILVRIDTVAERNVPASKVDCDLNKTEAYSQQEEKENQETEISEIAREIDSGLIEGDISHSTDYRKGDSFDVNDPKVIAKAKRTKTSRAGSTDFEEYLNREKTSDDSLKPKRSTRSPSAEKVTLDRNFRPRRHSASHVSLKINQKEGASMRQSKNEVSTLANAEEEENKISEFSENDEIKPFGDELSENRKTLTAVRMSGRTRSSSVSSDNQGQDIINTRSSRRRSTSVIPFDFSEKQATQTDGSILKKPSERDLKRASSTSTLLASGAKKIGKTRRVSAGSIFELKDSSKVSKISGHSLKPIKETDELSDFSEETAVGGERKINTPKKRRKREISSSKESLNESVNSQPERRTRSQLRKAQECEESTLVDEIENAGTRKSVVAPPPRTPERRVTRASSRLSSFNDSSDKSGDSSPAYSPRSLSANLLLSNSHSASQPMPVTPSARSRNFASSTPLATVPEDEPLLERRMTRNQKHMMEEHQKGSTPTKSKPAKKVSSDKSESDDAHVASTSTARPVQKARRGRARKNK